MKTTASYSPRAAIALGLLKRAKNDIDIYVEDKANPNMWIQYIRNIIPAHFNIESVSVLGSRENVLAACKFDQDWRGRARLYVIDGDFDILFKDPKPRLRHLYRLRAYCIENYFLNQRALLYVTTVADPRCSEQDARTRVAFDEWLKTNEALLLALFVCYGIVQRTDGSIQTVSFSVHRLLKDPKANIDLCPIKVNIRIFGLYREIAKKNGMEIVRKRYHELRKSLTTLSAMDVVSAKDYIFPLIYKKIKSNFQISISAESFKVMLASKTDRSADPYFARSLSRALRKRVAS